MRQINRRHLPICARRFTAGLLLAGMMLGTAGCGVVIEKVEKKPSQDGEEITEGAAVPRPQDDFYGYVNKEYLESLEVSYADMGAGYMMDIMDTVDLELYEMIMEIVESKENYDPGSNEQIVRDTWQQMLSYLDTESCSGKEYFTEAAGKIRAAGDLEGLKEVIRTLVKDYGITTYFSADVQPDFYDGKSYTVAILKKRSFAGEEMKDIYTDDNVRQNLRSFVLNTLIALGEDVETAKGRADALVYFAMDVACHTDFAAEKAPNPYLALDFSTDAETNALLSGNLTSKDLSRMYDLENPYGGWVIEDDEQLAFMAECFREENLEVLKDWLVCEVIYEWRDYLRGEYAFLEAYSQISGYEKEMLAAKGTVMLLPEQTSELYAEHFYTEEMDLELHRIYDDIVTSYKELMQDAEWLTEGTRARLIRKLENMKFICGGGKGHTIDPKDAKLIGKDVFETKRNLDIRTAQQNREKIGTLIDKEELLATSYTVNAAYSLRNSFTICVGILHAPYFDIHADHAENLGGIGMVMAHEIGHAFDSMCIDYDENGAYDPEGICREDREKLAERLRQMEDYYSTFSVMEIYYVDGELTSGENYADKGAMECLMNIVDKKEDRRKVFCNFAKVFAGLREDNQAIDALAEDEHSPELVRINAVLSSTDEFYEVYDVQPGDGMYVPPENRVSRYR